MKKTRIITLASLILCCMAIVGVGFAAWIITGDASSTQTGSITVDTVQDHRFVIDVIAKDDAKAGSYVDTDMNLGGPTSAVPGWLVYDGETEDLEAVLVVKVKNYDKGLELTAEITDKGYENLVTQEYIEELKVVVAELKVDGNHLTETDSEGFNYGYYTITITTKWGNLFDGLNPIEYFNQSGKSSAADGDEAFAALDVVSTKSELTFKVVVSADLKQ